MRYFLFMSHLFSKQNHKKCDFFFKLKNSKNQNQESTYYKTYDFFTSH